MTVSHKQKLLMKEVGTQAFTTLLTDDAPPTVSVVAAKADGAIAITAADATAVTSVNERESFMNNLSING